MVHKNILKYTEYKREQALFLQQQFVKYNHSQPKEFLYISWYIDYLETCGVFFKDIENTINQFINEMSGQFFKQETYNNINDLMDGLFIEIMNNLLYAKKTYQPTIE
jgi:hypothetical protein